MKFFWQKIAKSYLEIYIIPILFTFMYLVALNLLVKNQLNSSSITKLSMLRDLAH